MVPRTKRRLLAANRETRVPIYEQTYRHFEGRMQHRFRWAIIVDQEVRLLAQAKIFKLLILAAYLHCILRLLQVVAYDIIVQNPNNPLTPVLQNIEAIVVNERMFFDFIRIQSPLVFIICLYAGAGMICNDLRNNLVEVYFSKPIRWYDYALGKLLTLVILGMAITAAPALLLVLLHNSFVPSWELVFSSWWWPLAIIAFSLLIILPTALGILACSSLFSSQNYAAIAIFMVLIANTTMGGVLAAVLRERNYLLLSFPMSLNRVGQALFGDRRVVFELGWQWPLVFVVLFCLWAAWVVFRRARRAEMGS